MALTKQKLMARTYPSGFCDAVVNGFDFLSTRLVKSVTSKDRSTTKLLIETFDLHRVEAVVIRHKARTTICVSSQVGCQMGCKFCATGTMGILGDLTGAEIIEQIVLSQLNPEALDHAPPLRNVVFMGMGEPLNNYNAVHAAVTALTDAARFGLSRQHVTVSTVGVVPGMSRLTADLPGVLLALSLHAPNQKLREEIVPAAKAWPLPKLIAALDAHILACSRYSSATKFKGLMVEYVLIREVNDAPAHAAELASLLADKPVMVNIIPYNPNVTAEMHGFEAPTVEAAKAFGKTLMDHGLKVRLRIERGQDIQAACGQLALVNPSAAKHKSSAAGGGVNDIEESATAPKPQNASNARGITRPRKRRTPRTTTAAAHAITSSATLRPERQDEVDRLADLHSTTGAPAARLPWRVALTLLVVAGAALAALMAHSSHLYVLFELLLTA